MKITPDDFASLHDFPAHVLSIEDFAVVWVDLDDDQYVGLVLRLQHPEMDTTFDQLYRVHPRAAAFLISELALYLHPPEPL